ncbi:hypothetical protein N2152v2_006432 [Parachlorella kessleri]
MPALHFNVISPTSRPAKSHVPTLYTHTLCPYAERAFLVLLEKGAPFNLVHVDLSCKPTWYRQVNPRGLVPAVEYKGAVHVESLDICRWADAKLEGPPLMPSDGSLRQEVDQLLGGVDSCVSAGLNLLAGRSGRYWGIGSGQSASQRAAFEAQLSNLQAALQRHGGPFLAGPHPTLADIAYYPFIRRFGVGMERFAGYDVTTVLGGSVGRWLDAMGHRESCRVSSADDVLLLQAYERHRCLDFFDYDSYEVFDLHPQNRAYLPIAS